MMLTWKYTLPAFVFPFAFTLSAQGRGLLMQGTTADILLATTTAIAGVIALAAGLGGWMLGRASALERVLATTGGVLLFYAGTLTDILGGFIVAVALALHGFRRPPAVLASS